MSLRQREQSSLPAAIAAMIGEFNELYPGQPASPEVLKSLLKELIAYTKEGNLIIGRPDDAYFWLRVEDGVDEGQEKQRILLEFKGPSGPGGPPFIAFKSCDVSEEGLLQVIVDAKELLKRYHRDGVCEECKQSFRWRLKLEGGAHCLQCTVNNAMGFRKDTV
jgi:hypothetical protein